MDSPLRILWIGPLAHLSILVFGLFSAHLCKSALLDDFFQFTIIYITTDSLSWVSYFWSLSHLHKLLFGPILAFFYVHIIHLQLDDINKILDFEWKPAEILRISLGDDRLEKLEKKLGCLLILIVFCCGNHWKFWDDRLSLEFCWRTGNHSDDLLSKKFSEEIVPMAPYGNLKDL